ncbi:MAG: hypothetical protein ACNFW9_01805 [Candidatus Kerfeldbacteria bacterium]
MHILILAFVGIVFVIIYSWLYSGIEPKFSSPDETANYFFTNLFANESQLKYYEPLNQLVDGVVMPRSMGFVDGYTVPSSFLGMIIIFGLIAKVLGTGIILLLTPIFSVIGVIFFYLLLKNIFTKNIAFISSLLLFFLPTYWLYSSRGMFHNILFISLLIIGFYYLVLLLRGKASNKKMILFSSLSGFFLGLSIITRMSEIVWVGLIVLVLLVYKRNKLDWKLIVSFLVPVVLLLGTLITINYQIYGGPLPATYSSQLVESSVTASSSSNLIKTIGNLIFPFGLNFELIGKALHQYLVLIFPWYSILLLTSIIWFCKNVIFSKVSKIFPEVKKFANDVPKKIIIYFLTFLIMSVWLILYYGSFEFYEYIDKTKIIFSSSYLRYWLPIYIFGIPLLVMGVVNIASLFKSKRAAKLVTFLLIIGFVYFSLATTIVDPLHGISQVKRNNIRSLEISTEINDITSTDSIIISGFADKVFFPERKVVVELPGDARNKAKVLSVLLDNTTVYYYHSMLDNDSVKTIEELKKLNVRFNKINQFEDDYTILYQLQ